MADEKRHPRTYKINTTAYKNAMKRAKKEKGKLSNLVENVVLAYSYGMEIKVVKVKDNRATALDVLCENFSERITAIK